MLYNNLYKIVVCTASLTLVLSLSSCTLTKLPFQENNVSMKTFSHIPKPPELRVKDLQNKGAPVQLKKAPVQLNSQPQIEKAPQFSQRLNDAIPLEQNNKTQANANNLGNPEERLLWPVKGKVVITFNEQVAQKKIVPGIHILAYKDCPVKAAESGIVQYSGKYTSSMNVVVINSYPNTKIVYGYLGGNMPKSGEKVSAGQIIGQVIGKEERPVLYFAVRKNNVIVDPLKYLQ